jgi:hypothetical protein
MGKTKEMGSDFSKNNSFGENTDFGALRSSRAGLRLPALGPVGARAWLANKGGARFAAPGLAASSPCGEAPSPINRRAPSALFQNNFAARMSFAASLRQIFSNPAFVSRGDCATEDTEKSGRGLV